MGPQKSWYLPCVKHKRILSCADLCPGSIITGPGNKWEKLVVRTFGETDCSVKANAINTSKRHKLSLCNLATLFLFRKDAFKPTYSAMLNAQVPEWQMYLTISQTQNLITICNLMSKFGLLLCTPRQFDKARPFCKTPAKVTQLIVNFYNVYYLSYKTYNYRLSWVVVAVCGGDRFNCLPQFVAVSTPIRHFKHPVMSL